MPAKLSDVARLAGISKTTASFALNDEGGTRGISPDTVMRVKAAARQLGYVPNQASRFLRKGRQHLVGFLAPNINDSFYASIAQGIETAAEKHGYQVLFGSTFSNIERERRYIESLVARRIDGLVILPTDIKAHHLDLLHHHHVPTVMFRRRAVSRRKCKFMTFDDVESARLPVAHLAARGCRNIGLVVETQLALPEWLSIILDARIDGYRRALRDAGLRFRRDNILEIGYSGSEKHVTATVEKYLNSRKPDGLFAIEDLYYLRMKNALDRLGLRVPQDIKVVGCDNSYYCPYLSPPLSSVVFPQEELGRMMMEELEGMIGGSRGPSGEILLPPTLAARQSSK
ncbi:MAG: LacI family DNA-binding transcriptional regulator [Candidatus Sumerlaeota bacterium]|nr:LacI family DNA-binding transcriptional regulator [Candidatus Sumerlaeota bacterium]